MKRYRITFRGRRIGAIGQFSTFTEEIVAETGQEALNALYARFEHIYSITTVVLPLEPAS